MSKLRLKEDFSVIDVGCGSGSITVELCLQMPSGKVYAIDIDEKATELTRQNLKKFGVEAEIILAKAQDILPSLPKVDAVIVGGNMGRHQGCYRGQYSTFKRRRQNTNRYHSHRDDICCHSYNQRIKSNRRRHHTSDYRKGQKSHDGYNDDSEKSYHHDISH